MYPERDKARERTITIRMRSIRLQKQEMVMQNKFVTTSPAYCYYRWLGDHRLGPGIADG
jgi:hypothetical protein